MNAPLIPGSWDSVEEDNKWSTIYPLGREARPDIFFHARLIYRPTALRGVYVCVGPNVVLQNLADRIASDALAWTQTWSGVAAVRADGGANATAIKAAWPDERPIDPDTLLPIGIKVMLRATMAGFLDDDGE